jgi:structure-specific recognition protein 1
LSRENGKCRFAESGLGWKPAGGGDTFTLDQSNIGGAQWSRAARGYEVKVLQRNSGVIQLDGFQQEVGRGGSSGCARRRLTRNRTTSA